MSQMENDEIECGDPDCGAQAAWQPGPTLQESIAKAAGHRDADDAKALEKLMQRMSTRRSSLLGILDLCREPHGAAEVDACVAKLQAHNASVYDGAALCSMLQQAGALETVADEDETADTDDEPQIEVVDGVEYLRPAKPAQKLWRTTEIGLAYLDSFDPKADLARLLADDAAYMDIYLRVLDMCADNGGTTTPALSAAIDKDPLVQLPRFFAQHFTERLEKAGAVEWDGAWKITDLGRSYLEDASH